MEPTDIQFFLEALNEMGEFFADELGELRQRTYWRLLGSEVSLDEWTYACDQAMSQETFHKVPLPKQLVSYVAAYRQEQARHAHQREEYAALRRQLTAPPAQMIPRAELVALVRQLCEDLEMRGPQGHPECPPMPTRIRPYRLPLDADAIEDRKAVLRAQARSLEEQRNGTPSRPQ